MAITSRIIIMVIPTESDSDREIAVYDRKDADLKLVSDLTWFCRENGISSTVE